MKSSCYGVLAVSGLIGLNTTGAKSGPTWIAASWVFDDLVAKAIEYLDASAAPSLAGKLRIIQNQGALRAVWLGEFPRREVTAFAAAVRRAESEYRSAGPSSFSQPEFYPGFMRHLRELLDMLDSMRPREMG